MELIEELNIKRKQLEVAVGELKKTGRQYAQDERDYKILLRQEVLKLRDKGEAIGVIDKICYGIPSVAEKRFARDVSKTTYEACQEYINSLKLQIRIIENQIAREWSIQ